MNDSFSVLGVRPENSELSEATLEELLVNISNWRDATGKPVCIRPNAVHFTREQLIRWFGWTDADFAAANMKLQAQERVCPLHNA